MKLRWLPLSLLPLLAACNSNSGLSVKSDTVSQQQIDTIIQNIQTQYPKLDHKLQQQILDVAVRAIENMVFVKGGSFMMGDFRAPCDAKDAKRIDWTPEAKCLSSVTSRKTGADHLHKVTLDSYSLSKYETSMADLDVYFQTLGEPYTKEFVQWHIGRKTLIRGSDTYKNLKNNFPNLPASTKSWQQAKNYCKWLGKITLLPFDLPTEAQWEYAARSGGRNIYYATNNGYIQLKNGHYFDPKLDMYVDYKQSEWNYTPGVGKIAQWKPNPLGFYDLTGNAVEWVNDWYSNDYYKKTVMINPKGPKSGDEKVIRGFNGDRSLTITRGHTQIILNDYFSNYSFRCSAQ